jgi:hypothetical protein
MNAEATTMSNKYTRKDGTVVRYKQNPNRDHGNTSGTRPNLTLTLADPSLAQDLTALAEHLHFVNTRGTKVGSGSVSRLVQMLGEAVREQGPEAVARRLKFIAGK